MINQIIIIFFFGAFNFLIFSTITGIVKLSLRNGSILTFLLVTIYLLVLFGVILLPFPIEEFYHLLILSGFTIVIHYVTKFMTYDLRSNSEEGEVESVKYTVLSVFDFMRLKLLYVFVFILQLITIF